MRRHVNSWQCLCYQGRPGLAGDGLGLINTLHLIVLAAGPLFAQVAWLRGYDLRQSTRLKLIPSCPAGRVIGLGTRLFLPRDHRREAGGHGR